MFCSNCGKKLPENARFCLYCGAQAQVTPESLTGRRFPDDDQAIPLSNNTYATDRGTMPSGVDSASGNRPIFFQNTANPFPDAAPPQEPYTSYGTSYPYQQHSSNLQQNPFGQHKSRSGRRRVEGIPEMAIRAGKGAARAATQKKMIGILCLIAMLLMALLSMVYTTFIKSGTPEDTIKKLEKALNDVNMDAMMACFDSQTNDLYSGILSIAGELSGVNLEAWIDLGSGLGGLMAGSGQASHVTITIQNVTYSDKNNCIADVIMTTNLQEDSYTENLQVPMEKVGREWLISIGSMGDLLY